MKLRTGRTLVLLACLTLAWSACSDDSDDDGSAAACDKAIAGFRPCGGDVSGTWGMKLHCMEAEDETCPEAKTDIVHPKETRFVFQGGRIKTDGTGESTIRSTAPASCHGFDNCEEADQFYRVWMEGSCEGTAKACACEMTIEDYLSVDSPYRVAGNLLYVEDDGGEEAVFEYCVKGSTLQFRPQPKGGGTDEDFLVLERK